jgi:hypothetical protein
MDFVNFNDGAEHYLCAAVLCPCNATSPVGAEGILRRLLYDPRLYSEDTYPGWP